MSCRLHPGVKGEATAREPHEHYYADPANAQSLTCVHVNARGIVELSEEALEGLLHRLGMVETSKPEVKTSCKTCGRENGHHEWCDRKSADSERSM